MNVNDDFGIRVLLHGDSIDWEDSPMAGVQRRRLDRVNAEQERVTTIVRYAPDSHFSAHVHGGGEEFIVLDGVFEDDYGQWPAGSYIRNPPQSKHTPGSTPGCTILVKLWQFHPDDRTFVHIDTNKIESVADAHRPGTSVTPLYADDRERVRLEHWQAGATIDLDTDGGAELFVLEGGFEEGGDTLRKHSWLRLPSGSRLRAKAGDQGARVWIKQDHLRDL